MTALLIPITLDVLMVRAGQTESWAVTQMAEQTVRVGVVRAEPERIVQLLREVLRLDGSAYTYRNFFWSATS